MWHKELAFNTKVTFKKLSDVPKNTYPLLASAKDWPPEEHLSLSPFEEDTDGSWLAADDNFGGSALT